MLNIETYMLKTSEKNWTRSLEFREAKQLFMQFCHSTSVLSAQTQEQSLDVFFNA